MSYKYYSLLRPVGPGTIPSGVKIEDVVNFDRRQLVPEIGREAWGYFTATDPLPVSDIRNYDLFYWEDFEWSSPAHGVRAEERLALLSAARVYSRVNEDAPAFLDPLEDSRKKRIISRGDCEDILRAASPAGDRTLVRIKIRNRSLDDRAVRNLDNMLTAKGRLIKKALGLSAYAPLSYRVSGLDVEFFVEVPDDLVMPAAALFGQMCALAVRSRSVSPKPTETENERYTFRVWLVRLGLSGPEHKETRAALLRNLQGDSAFIHGRKK